MPASTAFEATLIAAYPNPGSQLRGLQAGATYKLRQQYLLGVVDPGAHTLAKSNPGQLSALTTAANLTTFDAITSP